jgi:AraC-like DNA-binding protein
MEVGCTSLGSFSSRFSEVVGMTPSEYRSREHHAVKAMPNCIAKQHTRPERGTKGRKSARKTAPETLSRIEEAPAQPLQ